MKAAVRGARGEGPRYSLERIARVFRQIIGAPEYERYLEHQHLCHPDQVPLTRDEFARERLADRYSRPGTRCC